MKNPASYVRRDMENDIRACLDMPEIIAVVGSRQCGKTTMLNKIIRKLPPQKVTAIDFEDRDELNLFVNDIKGFVELHVKGKEFLFIDEFQYAVEGGRQLKYIYDNHPVKIIITGSSATELSIQSIKYLVGRIFIFTLHPFSFVEFMNGKDSALASLMVSPSPPSPAIIERLNAYYQEYVVYGGYPRAALADSRREKELVLKNVYNTYLLKEIRQILNYNDDLKLERLIRGLALQVGSVCNYNELSALTGFSYKDLMKALDILTKTFVIAPCRPFFTNKRQELVKAPKFYFNDNGFRNMACRNFAATDIRNDTGALHENFIAGELLKKEIPLRYWRTKSKAEVDFIADIPNGVIPIEVKTTLSKPAVTRSFRSFLERYSPSRAVVTSDLFNADKTIADIPIYFRSHFLALPDLLAGLKEKNGM